MTAYIVRLQKDGALRQEFAGIYVAHSIEELEEAVDACCPKFACEYAALPRDTMYGPDCKVPGAERLYVEDEMEARGGAVGDDWPRLFFGGATPQWQPLCEGPGRTGAGRHQAIKGALETLHSPR